MKKIVSILAATALAATFTGCGSSDKGQAVNSEKGENPVKIAYWYAWTDKIQENNVDLTKKFNETVGKEKGIEVTAQYQGSYTDLHQKLQAAHIANSVPAVAIMEIASTKAFAENRVIESLDRYIERDGVDMNDFYPGLLKNARVEYSYYAMPYLRSTPILYMNTTLLKKAGLDPSGPKTWEELAYYAKEIKEKTGAYGLTMSSDTWTLEAFLLQSGTGVLTEDESKTNLGTEKSKDALKYFRDLKDKGYIRIVTLADKSKITADFINQKTAMWFASTADLTKTLQNAQENSFQVNTAFIPKNIQYGVPTGGGNLVMTSRISEKEKEAAWEFIKWMTEPEQAAHSSEFTGYVSTRRTSTADPKIQKLFSEKPVFKVALDQLELYGTGRPMNPGYVKASSDIIALLDAIWVNGAEIDSAVDAAVEKINKKLAE